jgi:hypothetical protein
VGDGREEGTGRGEKLEKKLWSCWVCGVQFLFVFQLLSSFDFVTTPIFFPSIL